MESVQATGALAAFVLHDATEIVMDRTGTMCSVYGKDMTLVAMRLYVLLMAVLMILQRFQPSIVLTLAHGLVLVARENLIPGINCYVPGSSAPLHPNPEKVGVLGLLPKSYETAAIIVTLCVLTLVTGKLLRMMGLVALGAAKTLPVTATPETMIDSSVGLLTLILKAIASRGCVRYDVLGAVLYWRLTWNPWALLWVVVLLAKRGTKKMAMQVGVMMMALTGHVWFAFLLMIYVEAPGRKQRLIAALLISASLVPCADARVQPVWYVVMALKTKDKRYLMAALRNARNGDANYTVLIFAWAFVMWMLGPIRKKRRQTTLKIGGVKNWLGFIVMLLVMNLPGVGAVPLYYRENQGMALIHVMISVASWLWGSVMVTVTFWCDMVREGIYSAVMRVFLQLPLELADFALSLTIMFFAILVIRRRLTPTGASMALSMLAIIRYCGAFWCWQMLVAATVCVNVCTLITKQAVCMPGLIPMIFVSSFTPVTTYILAHRFVLCEVPSVFYLAAFFGVLALEFAPLLNKPVLVIEKDVSTGRIIKQELRSGLLSRLIFGDISVTWDALVQSAKIGDMSERTFFKNLHDMYRRLVTFKHAGAELKLFDPNNVSLVTDMRASGIVKQHGKAIANCQSIKIGDKTAILANIHAIYDEAGKPRQDLTFEFPGCKLETKAEPVLAKAGSDLALLTPEKDVKYAWNIGSQQPTDTAMVVGYDLTGTPFQKFVRRPKTGLVQVHLERGHSGSGLVNIETGCLVGLLWLTSQEAKLAQFVGLNPLLMTQANGVFGQASVSDAQLKRGELEGARQKLKEYRKKAFSSASDGILGDVNRRLISIEEAMKDNGDDRMRELAIEHRMWLKMAEDVMAEKKTVLQKLKLARSEKEVLLREKSRLITDDNGLLQELKLKTKQLQSEYDDLTDQVKQDYGYVIPDQSRMPGVAPKVCWPILYKHDEKWICYWSKSERVDYDESPVTDPEFLARVSKETGLNRKNAIKFAVHHMFNADWARSIIEGAPLEQSVIGQIIAWVCGDSQTYCGYCDRPFKCTVDHNHDDKCRRENLLNAERHRDYCGANRYENNEVAIEGWTYPVENGRLALGHGKAILVRCRNARHDHQCLTNVTPQKRSEWYRLTSRDGDWWASRRCLEAILKEYRGTEIPTPENDNLACRVAEQNLAAKQSAEMCLTAQKLHTVAQASLTEALSQLSTKADEVGTLEKKLEDLAAELERGVKNTKILESEVIVLNISVNGKEQALLKARTDKDEAILRLEKVHAETVKSLSTQIQKLSARVKGDEKMASETEERRGRLEDKKNQLTVKDADVTTELIKVLEEPVLKQSKVVSVGDKTRTIVPVGPFVTANERLHKQWNNNVDCQCHECVCKETCRCVDACIHCNVSGHMIDTCVPFKTNKCPTCDSKPSRKGKRFCCESDPVCVVCLGQHHAHFCHARKKSYYYKGTERLAVKGNINFEKMYAQPDFHNAPPPTKCGWSNAVAENLRKHSKDGKLIITYTGGLFSRALLRLVPRDLEIKLACTPTCTREKIMAEMGVRYPLVSFVENNVAVDPLDLENGKGVFDVECECGDCVYNFMRDTCQQSAAPVKNFEHLLARCLEEESLDLAKSREPGPGFGWLVVKPPGHINWPLMAPCDILLRTDWNMRAPSRVGVSDRLDDHIGSVTNEGAIPQRGEKILTRKSFERKETRRYPTETCHKHLEGVEFVPSSPCTKLAHEDVQKFGDVEHEKLSSRLNCQRLVKAIKMVLDDLKMQLGSFEIAKWSQVEAQRNWSASPGYPYNARFTTAKAAYRNAANQIKANMDKMFDQWAPTIWNIIAKDEILPQEKAKQKVRTILGPSLDHQLVSQLLTLNIATHHNEQYKTSHSQIGSSKYHGHYHDTIGRLQGEVVEYDAKGWDRHVHPTLVKLWFWAFWCLLKSSDVSIFIALSNVFESIIYSYMTYSNGQLVRKNTGLPSGHTLTASMNTLIHMTIQLYSRLETGSPADFVCYGDDGLMTCEGNPERVREVFGLFGMNLDKNFKKGKTPEGLTWLGTQVKKVDGVYVPAGSPEKSECHAYWSSGLSDGSKPMSYELVVAYALYTDLIWNEEGETRKFFDYLRDLADSCKKSGISGKHYHETLGTIDATSVIAEVSGMSQRDVNMLLRAKLFNRCQ